VKKLIACRISLAELAVPVGFEEYGDFQDISPVMGIIMKSLKEDTIELGQNRPT